MKYVVFCYNTPTLCRTIKYTNSIWKKENTSIIYSDLVSNIPQKIVDDYKITVVKTDKLDKKRGLELIVKSCIVTNKIWDVIDSKINELQEDITLVVFRDNEIQESTIISRIKSKYSKINITLIEEGSGIYALNRVEPRYKCIKAFIYKIFGIGNYSLKNNPQGTNENLDKIICTKPSSILQKVDKRVNVEKLIPIFTYDLNDYIIKAYMGETKQLEKYDYVFLTQPLTDFMGVYERLKKENDLLLPKIFNILSRKGKVIIKLHPRDTYDYSNYLDDNISISTSKEAEIPFECLLQYYGNPQMISYFSSASVTINTDKPSIYIYKLFDFPNMDDMYEKNHLAENNIIVCESVENLEKIICEGEN